MYIFVENGRQVFDFPVILMVKVVERHWGPLVKEYIQTISIFPPGVMSMIVAPNSKSEDAPTG
jgi:hypothetical protein